MTSRSHVETIPVEPVLWDREAWCARPVVNELVAAYVAGRLLNCFGFHAQQFWMLQFLPRDQEPERQREAAAAALEHLKLLAPKLGADHSRIRHCVAAHTDRWDGYKPEEPDYELFSRLNDDSACGPESSHSDRCSDLFYFAPEVFRPTFLMARICHHLPESQQILVELGECLDEGVRPDNVYRRLLPRPEPPYEGEPVEGEWWIDCTDTPREPEMPENTLAYCSREAGELAPRDGWLSKLRSLLCRAGIERTDLDEFAEAVNLPRGVNLADLVDGLDQQIRSSLAPTVPYWDDHRKVLQIGTTIIKDLRKQRPGHQVTLFRAFQREGWPKLIKNPFTIESADPQTDGKPDVQLLRQTVRDCNRQNPAVIKFSVGDWGTTVSWELL